MERDPRRLIARLAVAVMTADGRITPSERAALEKLDELGIGSVSQFADDEIHRALAEPIDLPATCDGLVRAGPDAGAVILAALADIATSDQSLAPAEIDMFDTIASLLCVDRSDARAILVAAAEANDAVLARGRNDELQELHAFRPTSVAPSSGDTCRVSPDIVHAYHLLGLDVDADRGRIDAAYLSLIERYSPLKVAALGSEFAALAVRKLAAITEAFEVVRGVARRE